jgi:hypothetical protein
MPIKTLGAGSLSPEIALNKPIRNVAIIIATMVKIILIMTSI